MRPEIIRTNNDLLNKMEEQYGNEYPLYSQTDSWTSGMTYKYSPEDYPLTRNQLKSMQICGQLVGDYLATTLPNSTILEFRLDFVCNLRGRLFVTEVQTDDRGLPAMAITRNVRGKRNPRYFQGVAQSFAKALSLKSSRENPLLVITYPEEEEFYYAGFRDFARLCWAQNTKTSIIVTPDSSITASTKDGLRIRVPNTGATLVEEPDFVWDFSSTLPESPSSIQPVVSKQMLLDIWRDQNNPLAARLRKYIPVTLPPNVLRDISQKDKWILKPISGRWSEGVVIGKKTSFLEWEKAVTQGENLVAQEFIDPREEWFFVRDKKKGTYGKNRFFARIEGYYCLNNSDWRLADVLATCTSDIPVHGKRDCIIIPGKI